MEGRASAPVQGYVGIAAPGCPSRAKPGGCAEIKVTLDSLQVFHFRI
jgi:hypothetical protein